MKPENFKIDQLIEHLQGTCKSLQEGCQTFGFDEDDLTEEDHAEIDQEIFRCETCAWWYEQGDSDSEGNCLDCSIEEEEED